MEATDMVPTEEETQEGSPAEVESAEVAPGEQTAGTTEAELAKLREELEKERSRRKSFQSEKDKVEARLKELERADMDDKERLAAEKADLEVRLQELEYLNYQLYFEKVKREVAEEFKIPPKFHKYLYGRDEDELRETAKSLAQDISELGVKGAEEKAQEEDRPPFVPGGVPAPDIEKELDELRKKGDIQGVIRHKLFGRR